MYSDELVCSNESSRVAIASRGGDACTETQGAVEEVEPRGRKKRVGREHSRIEEGYGLRWKVREDSGEGNREKRATGKQRRQEKGRKQKKEQKRKNNKKSNALEGQ